ncbi:cell wall-active antibiotics response protein LiaF [Bacillus sp. 1P06AnD]|uniref:cell wall-active antibiotics response protein LiaF n=1 Tax=Bacillus sp. 1P06AnD TaxID=3132208 RepID=UPI0039A1544B
MRYQSKTDLFRWIAAFAIVVLLIEVTFFDSGLLFSLAMSGLLLYFGKKKWHRLIGKLAVIIGGISMIVTISNMLTFKLLLIGLLIAMLVKFFQSRKKPEVFMPDFMKEDSMAPPETLLSKSLLFKNTFIGGQMTPDQVYEWEDIDIQSGIGDIIIDLSNTVLPKGEAVISIRNIVGSIKVYVPYDVEVKIVHSVLAGSATILNNKEQRLINQSVLYYTTQYEEAPQKVKIVTTTLVGNIEVKRI